MSENGTGNPPIDNLYLDMNGIIHPCTHPQTGKKPESEDEMLENIMSYVDRIIRMAMPSNLLFMAIDGVAPRAKMNQQRARRYVGGQEKMTFQECYNKEKQKIENMIDEKIEESKQEWDSNVITPGTPFMKKLADALLQYVIRRQHESPEWKNLKVIISDASVPGEGEHKLLTYIREQRKSPKYNKNLKHCIHGMDADLIMLGLLTHESNFFILREDPFAPGDFNQKPQNLVNLSVIRDCLSEFTEDISQNLGEKYDFNRICDDFIFLFFLVGNDFVPNIPALDIEESALDILIDIYKVNISMLGGYITHGSVVHVRRLMEVFKLISMIEDDVFFHRYKVKGYDHNKGIGPPPNHHFKAEVKWAKSHGTLKNMVDRMASRAATTFQLPQEGLPDFIKPNDPDWKKKYYSWKLKEELEDVDKVIPDIATSYIEGLLFVWKYYTEGIPSWSYYYPFHYAPFSSDVYGHREHILSKFSIYKFNLDEPFKPFDQLLSVLPRFSSHCMPKEYAREMNDRNSKISHFYPDTFERDLNGKFKQFKAVILLPFIDAQELRAISKPLEETLNKEEAQRNSLGNNLFVFNVTSRIGKSITKNYLQTIKDGKSILVNDGISGKLLRTTVGSDIGKKIKIGEETFKNECAVTIYEYPTKYGIKRKNEEESEVPKKKVKKDDTSEDESDFNPISLKDASVIKSMGKVQKMVQKNKKRDNK